MKKYFLFLFLLPSLLYPQSDSLKKLLDYYPLQTGNYWEYESYYDQIPYPPSDFSSSSIEVIGDTLLENGRTYKILLTKQLTPYQYQSEKYERVDSLTGCVYRYINDTTENHEYMIDSLFANPGDSIYASRDRVTTFGNYMTLCLSERTDSVFGFQTQIKEYFDQSFIPGATHALAKGIGFLYGSVCEFGCGSNGLVYAKINGSEYGKKITSINNDDVIVRNSFVLNQNYPNPFNPNTVIAFQLPVTGKVSLIVYDFLGKEVAVLVDEEKPAGAYNVNFEGSSLASGVYFYTLRANNFVQNRKMILLK